MTAAELAQQQRETFARITFRRAYRLLRCAAKGDVAAIRQRHTLIRISGSGIDFFWARWALFHRSRPDPLLRPLHLRLALAMKSSWERPA